MKKAFITGASGHLGANLVRLLLRAGWQVRCLVHVDTIALKNLDVELVNGNLHDSENLSILMKGFDVVFHGAAKISLEEIDYPLMQKINVDGTRAMCQAAIKSNIKRFIYISSIHAFNQRPILEELSENRPLVDNLNSPAYDRTKAAAQKVVYAAYKSGLNAIILNPTGILGPFDFKPSRMGRVISDIMNRKMLFSINSGFNWVDVRDVCKTAINCIEKGVPGQHYILPGEWASFEEISNIISELIGKKTSYLTLPLWMAYLFLPIAFLQSKLNKSSPSFSKGSLHALAIQSKKISGELARSELGHKSRPLKKTLEDTISWISKNAN